MNKSDSHTPTARNYFEDLCITVNHRNWENMWSEVNWDNKNQYLCRVWKYRICLSNYFEESVCIFMDLPYYFLPYGIIWIFISCQRLTSLHQLIIYLLICLVQMHQTCHHIEDQNNTLSGWYFNAALRYAFLISDAGAEGSTPLTFKKQSVIILNEMLRFFHPKDTSIKVLSSAPKKYFILLGSKKFFSLHEKAGAWKSHELYLWSWHHDWNFG